MVPMSLEAAETSCHFDPSYRNEIQDGLSSVTAMYRGIQVKPRVTGYGLHRQLRIGCVSCGQDDKSQLLAWIDDAHVRPGTVLALTCTF